MLGTDVPTPANKQAPCRCCRTQRPAHHRGTTTSRVTEDAVAASSDQSQFLVRIDSLTPQCYDIRVQGRSNLLSPRTSRSDIESPLAWTLDGRNFAEDDGTTHAAETPYDTGQPLNAAL